MRLVDRAEPQYFVWLICILITLAVVSACGRVRVLGESDRASGQIAVETLQADFGTVTQNRPVSRTLDIRNEGLGVLAITELSTSCSCTTAEIEADRIPPGESATLTVSFDPRTHNGATGRFMRRVYVRSSDPDTQEVVYTFTVTVVEP